MSLTFLLLLMIGVLVTIGIITKKLDLLTYSEPDKNGNRKPNGFKWKPRINLKSCVQIEISFRFLQ